MRWLFLQTPPGDGAHNMALDEALMGRAARTGEAVLRIYGWSSPTVSLGRNQRARDCYDETRAKAIGVTFVRRPTGGRALLHNREVTYSVTLPMRSSDDARRAYDFINSALIAGLRCLGVAAERPATSGVLSPGLRPCFDVPANHEIAVEGRKLVGSAQWRHEGALLQHGSILVRDDQAVIGTLVVEELSEATPPAATLGGALGYEPSTEQVALVLRQSLEEATGSVVEPFVAGPDLDAEVQRLRKTYADAAWTWRR